MNLISSELLSPELSGLLDALVLLVLIGVWVLWWKQSKRSQRVEQSLLEAAAQLQEATSMLDDALSQIAILQQQEAKKQEAVVQPEPRQQRASVRSTPQVEESQELDDMEFPSQARASLEQNRREIHAVDTYEAPSHAQVGYAPQAGQQVGTMDVARILRMQREGQSLESIASTLDIPLAQVKLMLMLQKGVA